MSCIVSKDERSLLRTWAHLPLAGFLILLVTDAPPLKGTPLGMHRCLGMVCAFIDHRMDHYHYQRRTRNTTLYLLAIAIYRMPHSPHICLALRLCHILQYSFRFGYLACHCICFAISIFYRSETYSLIFTLSSTMPSVLHIPH
jgi:hypothetical protein